MPSATPSPSADFIRARLNDSRSVVDRALQDAAFIASVEAASDLLVEALTAGRTIFLVGNGGSAADAQHLAAELVGRFTQERRALAAIALTTDTSILTAVGNDYGFREVFSRQVQALGRAGDVLVALSTSGRSVNIIAAVEAARQQRLKTIGFSGASGGALPDLCDVTIRAPSENTAMIQQIHITAGHILCGLIERRLFPQPGNP